MHSSSAIDATFYLVINEHSNITKTRKAIPLYLKTSDGLCITRLQNVNISSTSVPAYIKRQNVPPVASQYAENKSR